MSRYRVKRFSSFIDEYRYLSMLFSELGNPAGDDRLLKIIQRYEDQIAKETDPSKLEYLRRKLNDVKTTYNYSGPSKPPIPVKTPTPPNVTSNAVNNASKEAKGLGKLGKYGLIGAGVIGAGYLGKKIYDNYNNN